MNGPEKLIEGAKAKVFQARKKLLDGYGCLSRKDRDHLNEQLFQALEEYHRVNCSPDFSTLPPLDGNSTPLGE